MSSAIYIVLCLATVMACAVPLGTYMARVYAGQATWLRWLERPIYRICGIVPELETGWRGYAAAILMTGLSGILFLYAMLLAQGSLPLNPQNFPGLAPDLAFNVAMSFITNTDWQSYSGEVSLSYFSQMAGLVVQYFISAAASMVVAVAFFRGLARRQTHCLGNAYADMVRSILYILLPLSVLYAVFLVSQGAVQNFLPYTAYHPVEGAAGGLIAQGPAASQVAIKLLGSNGGGFFNANSAHPFENPNELTNFLEIIAILLIPVATVFCFGIMVGDRRQGWMILAAMTGLFLPLLAVGVYSEHQPNPRMDAGIIDQSQGNMEGKETRFGTASSVLFAAATTATATGAVNSMHDSFMPYTGLMPLLLMQFGGVVYGGVGSGMYGMLMFVLLAVFFGGLMVGRTPEYLGKKLGPYEVKMASLILIVPAMTILIGSAVAVCTEAGRAGVLNGGAQGFSEILYAFTSATFGNGSAFAGLSANSPFYNIALGITMFVGRFWIIIPTLAVAGSLAAKNTSPVGAGTLPTHTPLFAGLVIMLVLIGELNYVPALVLGPVAEHMRLVGGTP